MVETKSNFHDGDLVSWNGSSRVIYGIVRRTDKGFGVFTDDRHCFDLSDIEDCIIYHKSASR